VGAVITVAAIAFIGGIVALTDGGGSEDGLDPSSDLVVPIPGAADSWIVETPRSSGVMRVDAGDGDPAWTGGLLEDAGLGQQVAVDKRRVYLSDGRQVTALDVADGKQLWSVTLGDEVEPRAPECLACFDLVDDRLLVQTIDGEVHGLDVADGKEAWSHRFVDPTGRALLVDRSLVIVDGRDDDLPGAELLVLDPSDGGEVSRATPECTSPNPSVETSSLMVENTLVPVEGEPAVVAVVGESPACRQRIDLTTGAKVWSVPNQGGDVFASTELVQSDGIAYVQGAGIERIDLATGELTTLLETEDSESITPSGMVDGVLLVTSTLNRGSAKSRLIGVDPASGERMWIRDLGLSRPYAPGSAAVTVGESSPSWLWAEGSDGNVRVLTFAKQGDDGDLRSNVTIDELDPRTGERRSEVEQELDVDSPFSFTLRVLERRKDELVLNLDDRLQVLDVRTGNVTARWP
jgi:outer membrane protein assembly factor BamB